MIQKLLQKKLISTDMQTKFFIPIVLMFLLLSTAFLNAQNVLISDDNTMTPETAGTDGLLQIKKTLNSGYSLIDIHNYTALGAYVKSDIAFKTGGAGATSIYYTGLIRTIGSGTTSARMGFFTGSSVTKSNLTEKMTILDGGNVGINDTNPSARLLVNSATYTINAIEGYHTSASTTGSYGAVRGNITNAAYTSATAYLCFHSATNSTYGVYCYGGDYGGFFQNKVVIGNDHPVLTINTGDLEVVNTTAGADNPASLSIRQSTSETVNGKVLGNLNFGDNYRSDAQASISVMRGATSTDATDLPTAMIFSNIPDGSSTLTERMRISNSGNVGIGDPTPASLLTVGNGDLFQVNSSGNLVKLNNVTYSWPSAQGSAKNALVNDGSGNLSWTTDLSDANAWKLTGNTGTTAGANFIGTTDAQDLVIKTGVTPTERMRIINNSNNIILGTGEASATLTGATLRGPNATGADIAGVNFILQPSNGTGIGGSGDILFNTAPVAATSSTANTMAERMRITKSGNVGIGTNNPSNLLSFTGDNDVTVWQERATNATYVGKNLTIQAGAPKSAVSNKAGGSLFLSSGISTGTGSSAIEFQTSTAGLTGTTDNAVTSKMYILGNGNVGIGIAAPLHLLHVSGTNTDITGADGVFIDIENLNNTAPDGAIAGVRFKSGSTTSPRYKGGIFYKQEASYGRGDMYFVNDNTGDNNPALTSDARMIIKNSGNVGIGTTTPANILDVEGAAVIGATYSGTSTAPANGLLVEGNTCIGSTTVNWPFEVKKGVTAATGFAKGVNIEQTLTAAANSDKLHALHIKPTFTNGAYTSVDNYGLVVEGYAKATNMIYTIPLWQTGRYDMANTAGSDLSKCESGIDPTLYDLRGELEVRLVIRVDSATVGSANNFQLRTHNGTTETYPIVNTDSWTTAATQKGWVYISPWKSWSAGTSACEVHLHGWTLTATHHCYFNSAYLLVRAKP